MSRCQFRNSVFFRGRLPDNPLPFSRQRVLVPPSKKIKNKNKNPIRTRILSERENHAEKPAACGRNRRPVSLFSFSSSSFLRESSVFSSRSPSPWLFFYFLLALSLPVPSVFFVFFCWFVSSSPCPRKLHSFLRKRAFGVPCILPCPSVTPPVKRREPFGLFLVWKLSPFPLSPLLLPGVPFLRVLFPNRAVLAGSDWS